MRTWDLSRRIHAWAYFIGIALASTTVLGQSASSNGQSGSKALIGVAEPKADGKTAPKGEAKPKAKAKGESQPKSEVKAKPRAKAAKPKTKAEPKARPKVEEETGTPAEAAAAAATTAATAQPPQDAAKRVPLRIRPDLRVTARVYADVYGRVMVESPDGKIGQIQGQPQYTEEPFRVWSKDEIRDELLREPGLANFRSRTTKHFVVVYDSTDKFAENSANLLESLYVGLLQTFKEWGLDVHEAEFPLIAIIYGEEDDFRRRMAVAPEVQAYYETQTNRIVFYENSDRNKGNPEIAEMRKPQVVAHEGAHQILHNIGVQPRMASWPIWLSEGMAEFCAPTLTKKNAEWAGAGRVNAIHMATIRDLNDPISQRLRSLGIEPKPVERDPKMTLVEHLVRRTDLNPTEYALCWAQTHYLAIRRKEEFREYLKIMASLKPLEEKSPQDHWDIFRSIFLRDPLRFDKDVAKHVIGLKNYEPLPYFAVLFEHPIPGGIRRAAFVSQSPSIIQQNLNQVQQLLNGQVNWRAVPCPTRAKADILAKQLLQGGGL